MFRRHDTTCALVVTAGRTVSSPASFLPTGISPEVGTDVPVILCLFLLAAEWLQGPQHHMLSPLSKQGATCRRLKCRVVPRV